MPKRVSLADAIPATADPSPSGGAGDDAPVPVPGPRPRPVLPVDIASIRIPDGRLRKVDEKAADRIADSIARVGLQSPVVLRPDPDDPALHILIAGAHRLEAVRRLGWSSIEALIVDAETIETELIEIDENLIREKLTALDRGRFLHRRRHIFSEIHNSGRGGDRKSADHARNAAPGLSWAEDAASSIGLSPRAVQRAASIGANISPALAEALADTPIARREGDLFRLSQMPISERDRALQLLQTAQKPPETLAELLGLDESDASDRAAAAETAVPTNPLERIKESWAAAPPDAKAQFVSWLQENGWISEPDPPITGAPENAG